jgi:parallel beta-helix repeat protein
MTRALAVAVAVSATTLLGASAAGATEVVDNDRVQCPNAAHTTIQDGVDAASAGETVLVCRGVYREAVTISGSAKDGLRLRAQVVQRSTIKAPAGHVGPVVDVLSNDVEVSRFRIRGPFTDNDGTQCSANNFFGVRAWTGALRVKVQDNVISRVVDAAGRGCPFFVGVGVDVDSSASGVVTRNRVVDYASAGVVVANGAAARVIRNEIVHSGRTGITAGVSVFNTSGKVTVQDNVVEDADMGIELDETFGPNGVLGNQVFDNGIGVRIHPGVANTSVFKNIINDNDQEGILSGGEGNRFERNDARGNGGTDCRDTSTGPAGSPFFGTANRWRFNQGLEANPPGICTPRGLV